MKIYKKPSVVRLVMAVGTLSLLMLSTQASAFCHWASFWTKGKRVIPVYLSRSGDQDIGTLIRPGTTLRIDTIERYTRLALDTWNEDDQSNIRFVYKGFWNAADDNT